MNKEDAQRIEELDRIITNGTKDAKTRYAALCESNGIQNKHFALRLEIIDGMIADGSVVQTDGSANELLDTCLRFLDKLRKGGTINMFGAAPELARTFTLSAKATGSTRLSKLTHAYWMKTFGCSVR